MSVPPRIWVRRIVSTTLLLAVLAAVGYLLFMLGSWALGTLREGQQSAAASSALAPVEIEDCRPSELNARLEPSSRTLYVSEGMSVQFEVKAKPGVECSLDPKDINVSLTSGDYPIWTPTKCAPDSSLLLLTDKAGYTKELAWDARIYEECEQVEDLFAEVGTYQLSVRVGGGRVGDPIDIVVY